MTFLKNSISNINIWQILDLAIQKNASDIHLIVDYFPTLRINGTLFQIRELPKLNNQLIESFIYSILTQNQIDSFKKNLELDFSLQYQNTRFRINIYLSKKNLAASFRLIPNEIKNLDELNLPPIIKKLTVLNQGLILVTGQSGQGKSTTLASIINEINKKYAKHIITLEDPIEFIYPPAFSIISQREIGADSLNWSSALKAVLREDPDIILVGEMRDQETIKSALTLSETGHLVFSTLHTNTAAQTIDRIIDIFDSKEQNQIRLLLSMTLKAVICQRLIFSEKLNKRIPACEILFVNQAVSSLIREGKTHQIDNVIITSGDESMVLFEKSLSNLYYQGYITKEQAIKNAFRQSEIQKLIY